jgi:hypothetical protein
MRYLYLGLVCVMMSGCTQYAAPSTPEEAEAQESRMRYLLKETSPRNSSGLPKVVPEFTKSYGGSRNSTGSSQDVPATKQSEDDSESW